MKDERDRGRRIGQRELPADYVREATLHVAAPLEGQALTTHAAMVLRIGEERLALPAALVDEVAEPRPHHSLPQRRSGALLGVVNVRGELVPCVSLALLLGIEVAGVPEGRGTARLLVLRDRHRRVAVPADEVQGLLRYRDDGLRPLPATLPGTLAHARALLPLDAGRHAALIDQERLLRALERSLA
jgi:chemotaxis-related protein WspD